MKFLLKKRHQVLHKSSNEENKTVWHKVRPINQGDVVNQWKRKKNGINSN